MLKKLFLLFFFFLFGALFFHPGRMEAQLVNYSWAQEFYNDQNGKNTLSFIWKLNNLKISAADLMGNNQSDFVVGNERGELSFFENVGSDDEPNLVLKELSIQAWIKNNPDASQEESEKKVMNFGSRAAPAFIDLTQDQIQSLLVGNAAGELVVLENVGTPFGPIFSLPNPKIELFPQEAVREMKLENVVPSTCDLNNDGVTDLMLGTKDGRILTFYGFRNSAGNLIFPPRPNEILKLPTGQNASPSCLEMREDETKSILSGQMDGYLTLFPNIGSKFKPRFGKGEFFYQNLDFGGESAPFFLKGANKKLLLLAGFDSNLRQFEIRKYQTNPTLWSVKENILRVEPLSILGKKLNFTAGHLYNPDKMDILIGTEQGNVLVYRNDSSGDSLKLTKMKDNLFDLIHFRVSSVELGDLRGSGLSDLIVATDHGRIHYFKNVGTKTEPKFQMEVPDLIKIPGIQMPIPRLILNSDGLLDLVVGSNNKGLSFFKNVGTKNFPQFEQRPFEYLIDASQNQSFSAPAVFNWNKTKNPNLVIGNLEGILSVLSHNPQIQKDFGDTPMDFQEFISQPFRVKNVPLIDELSYIRPYFVDLLGRGKEDLFISNQEGDLLLFIQKDSSMNDPKKIYDAYIQKKLEERRRMIAKTRQLKKPLILDPIFVASNQVVLPNLKGKRIVPFLKNIYGNQLEDLVIGFADGHFEIYKNIGTKDFWNFQLQESIFLPFGQKNAAPMVVDLLNRGLEDIVVASKTGRLFYYQNVGTKTEPKWKFQPSAFPMVYVPANAIPSYIYTSKSSYPDILLGTFNGRMLWIKNESTPQGAKFVVENRNYLPSPFKGLSIAPRVYDVNNDGSPKFIFGNDQGQLKFYQLSKDQKKWTNNPKMSPNTILPYGAVPTFGFMRGLGVPDMLVGLDDGRLIFYRNDAITPESLKKLELDLEKLEE